MRHCPACGTPVKRPKKVPDSPLARRRAELGLSLQQTANLARLSKPQVWEIERSDRKANPRLGTLLGLARALQWPLDTLASALSQSPEKGID